MKLTANYIKQVIKEELNNYLNETATKGQVSAAKKTYNVDDNDAASYAEVEDVITKSAGNPDKTDIKNYFANMTPAMKEKLKLNPAMKAKMMALGVS